MDQLLLSRKTKQQLEQLKSDTPQSLLLLGQMGAGRLTIAKLIVATLLDMPLEAVDNYPYVSVIGPDGQSVKIEQVQGIKSLLRLKTPPSQHALRRFIIIESANLMTRDAQNAALKFIEEPPADTMIILIVEHERDLLPTIQSRCSSIRISNPTEAESLAYAADHKLGTSQQAASQFRLSGGRAGLFVALLTNSEHPLVQAMDAAKDLLRANIGDRLLLVDTLSKDKTHAQGILFALDRIAQVGLMQSADKPAQIKRWHSVLSALEAADKQLAANTSSKLVFTNLMLNL